MQDAQRMLYCALGEAGLFGHITVTEPHAFSTFTNRTPPQIQIDNESGSAVVMSDKVAQQDIQHILVNFEACHAAMILKTIATFKRLYRSCAVMTSSVAKGAFHV
jgi:hypothetical protein